MPGLTENTASDLRLQNHHALLDIPAAPEKITSSTTTGDKPLGEGQGSVHHIKQSVQESFNTTVSIDAKAIFQSRVASRAVAMLATDDEYESLIEEHAALVGKRFESGLSRSEDLRFQLVRWSIDRIEDARYGHDLDTLEQIAMAHEYVAQKLGRAAEDLERATAREAMRSKR